MIKSMTDKKEFGKKLPFYFFLSVLTAMLLLFIFIFFAPSKKANADTNVQYEKRIVSVRVAEDDSLWKIAERFYCSDKESIKDKVKDIKESNHLSSDTIYPDTYLMVQYYVVTK